MAKDSMRYSFSLPPEEALAEMFKHTLRTRYMVTAFIYYASKELDAMGRDGDLFWENVIEGADRLFEKEVVDRHQADVLPPQAWMDDLDSLLSDDPPEDDE